MGLRSSISNLESLLTRKTKLQRSVFSFYRRLVVAFSRGCRPARWFARIKRVVLCSVSSARRCLFVHPRCSERQPRREAAGWLIHCTFLQTFSQTTRQCNRFNAWPVWRRRQFGKRYAYWLCVHYSKISSDVFMACRKDLRVVSKFAYYTLSGRPRAGFFFCLKSLYRDWLLCIWPMFCMLCKKLQMGFNFLITRRDIVI